MVGANVVFMMTSYVIPQGIVAWRGRSAVFPKRHFDLGRWGVIVNIIACLWAVFLDVVACIPMTVPVTRTNMNWVR
jgi:choline transport protein